MLDTKRVTFEETLGLLSEKASSLQEQNPSLRHSVSDSYNSGPPKLRGASLRLQVEDLHLQGFSLAEIAQRLDLHLTEVKMALDLSRFKAK